MSFTVGMASGFACGFSSGLPVGMAAGRNKAKEDLRHYMERHGILIQDRSGRTILPEEILNEAVGPGEAVNKKAVLFIAVGLGLLVMGGLIFLLLYLKN